MNPIGIKDTLATLRATLKSLGCDGFLIPKTDPHQNEYIHKHFDRLEWITNFTGSAGLAIILDSTAALFVDGRYTLQAQEQVDKALFQIEPFTWKAIGTWIQKNLESGKVLGFDPWLTLSYQKQSLQAACQKAGGKLNSISLNPLDTLMKERPSLPKGLVIPHPIDYSGKSSEEKIRSLTSSMTEEQVDVLVLTRLDSIAWLLNIRGKDIPYNPLVFAYALLFSNERVELFLQNPDLDRLTLAHFPERVTLNPYSHFASALSSLGKKKIWIDPKTAPISVIEILQKEGVTLYEAEDPCILPKALKNLVEIEGARNAHIKDGAAMIQFLAWLEQEVPQGTVTEISAADYLLKCRGHHDLFQYPSFPTISATREHGAIIHYQATPETNFKLKSGDIYLVDSGGQYLDGTTDVTRTLALGKVASKEQKDLFTRVLKGHIALAQALFPKGTSGHQLDILARKHLWNVGLDFAHGTGHGVGSYLNVHEGPQSISTYPQSIPLEPGMILSNEPGYYKAGGYGFRIENLMVVKQASLKAEKTTYSFEILTMVPIDVSLIDVFLLTDPEIEWFNHYHHQVRTKISPLLDPFSAEWLEKATQPLRL